VATTKVPHKPERLSTAKREATEGSKAKPSKTATDPDPIVEGLKRRGTPVTREHYLNVLLGEHGIEVGPEMEEYLPPYLQRRRPNKTAKDLY
jgi:hypothetical protein